MLEKLSKPMAEIEGLFDATTAAFSAGPAIICPHHVSLTRSQKGKGLLEPDASVR